MRDFIAAAVQMSSSADKSQNIDAACELIAAACRRGAELVALPENCDFMGSEAEKLSNAETLDGPTFRRFAEAAREHRIWLLAGTISELTPDGTKVYNTSVLFDPEGIAAAIYRKIHLFDVDIPDGARYRESDLVLPGVESVVADTPLGRIGLSICYDVRFPELYRLLSSRGAEILTVPAAFTLHTGKDHWEVLLRARAIENTCWLIAPAQTGRHSEKRVTYGNSMIIDPWGTVVGRASDGTGFCVAELRGERLEQVRREIPSLSHRRLP